MEIKNKESSFKKEQNYGYYSKVLKKPFDTIEELTKAEKEYQDEKSLETKKLDEKKEEAKKVKAAYDNYIKTVEESNKVIKELRDKDYKAYQAYTELKNDFIEKYGYFYQCYYKKSNNDEIPSVYTNVLTLSDLLEEFFK